MGSGGVGSSLYLEDDMPEESAEVKSDPVVFMTNRRSSGREEWSAVELPCRCGAGFPGHWLIGRRDGIQG